MAGNWWEADEVDGSGEFWSADEVVDSTERGYLSDAPSVNDDVQSDYMRRMAARDPASALRHKAETEPGAGRGSANDPRRLDTEKGRKLQAVEGELADLAALNPWEPRESLRPAAESAASGHKPGKPADRVKQYMDKGMEKRGATANALFDERLEREMQHRIDGRDVLDAPIGGGVRLGYNPNTEAEATAARAKELKQSRADAMMRADAEGMNPVVRGFVKGAGQAVALTQGSAGLVGDLTGNDALKKWGLDGYAENMRAAGNLGVAKPFTQISSADDAATWMAENSGYVAFQAAQSILASGMGGVIGGTIGKKALGEAVGLAVSSASQTYGSVYAEAVEESQRTGKPLDMEKVLIGATVSTAIDTLADKIGLDAITAKGFKGNALSRAGKAFGLQAGVQGGTEMAQLVPEEFGAGRDPFRDGMLKQYIDEGAVGALGGVGPGVAMAVKRNISSDPARALSAALESEPLVSRGFVDASVANALRTEIGTSNAISPEATVMGHAPATQMQPAAPQVDAKAAVESARDAAMVDIGKAQSVDEAVAAANATVNLAGRAVQIDNDRLLNEAVQAAGIADALAPVEQPTMAAPAGAPQAAPVADGQPAAPVAPNFARLGAVAPSRVVWTGRRGDGYATPEDANRALGERQRLRPAYDWTVQQNPEGRYVLEGLPKGQDGAAQAVSKVGNTQVAPMAQNAPIARLEATDVSVPRQASQGSVWAKSDDGRVDGQMAAAVEDLAVASGAPGSIQLVSRAESLRELDVRAAKEAQQLPSGAATPDADSILNWIDDVGDAAAAAFGWRPTLVRGLRNAFGVQYRGRTYLDISQIAAGNRAGDSVQALAIQTIGHETTHALQKSADPQDRADWQRLRDVVLANAKDGVVSARVKTEGNDQVYGENEVVADVSGNFWLEPKFWQRLYELDNGSTMRRIAYKFMKNATRMLGALKSKRLDNKAFIHNVEQVREVAAQVWASKAKRGDSLFGGQDQTISKSLADDSRPGVSAEVAPDPRNQEAAQKWGKLTELDKLGITKEVMDKLAAKVFDKMGLEGWGVEYTSGMFEGGINPSAIIRAPQGTDAELLGEVMRVFGYLLDQKGMVAFDESNTTSGSQAGFVKVVLPKGLSTSRIDAIRKEIAAKVPQAEGDTVRDGAIVYGNFSALNDKIETLTDEQFKAAIEDAIRAIDSNESFDVAGPFVFHSEYDQAYWSEDTYDPKGREAYLEKTRYGNSEQQEAVPGRDGVRRWGRDHVFRPWLEALARSTDAHIAQLVGDKQPRTADARADRAGPAQPAQQGDRDRQGRPDAVRSRVVGVDASAVGGAGKDVSGAVHYGKVGRLSMLAGAMNGTGIKGAEAGRLAQATDPRIRQRVYFYLPVEGGIPQPESGLGQHVYKADLSNLYDTASQKMRLPADQNAMESAILDAGYSGFFNEAQGTVVVFGASVPVSYEGTSDQFNKVKRQPKAVKPKTVTRTEGDMLVRRPEGAEVMEVIKARQAGLEMAAPSFKMQYGEARVLKSEAATADAVFESIGASFRFDEPSYSRADVDVTETPNFRRWFGDSKVVDADGTPLRVFHGTNVVINEFKPSKGLRSAGGLFESSATSPFKFFSPDKDEAQSYANAKGGHLLYSVYLRMERPLDATTPDGLVRMHRLFGSLDDTELSDWADSAVDLLDGIDELRATTPAEKSYFVKRDAKGRVIGQRATEREGYILEKYTADDHAAEIEHDLAQLIAEYEALLSAMPSSDAPLSVWAALDEPDSGDRLRAAGFDGLIFYENDGKKTFAVLDSTQIKSSTGNNGNFDPEDKRINYSRADMDSLGAFNVDASLSEMTDAEMEKFGIEPVTEMDMAAIQAELEAEFAAEFGVPSKKNHSGPGKEAIAKAGLNAEDAFDFGGALKESGRGLLYDAPDFAQDVVARVRLGGAPTAPSATVDMLNHTVVFVNSGTARKDAVEKFIGRQIAGAVLHADGHDIASAYRKNTILNLAASWKAVARTAGVFKFSEGSKATGFTDIAKSMGAFKGYRVEVETSKTYNGFAVEFVRQSDGEAFSAEVTIGDGIGCCTMGLDGSGGLGTEFYAVMGRYAQNNGKRFLADDYLSGINSYRRTEQALSFALKSGDTGVLLPGTQNRVYGYNMRPKNQQDHDMNLARLALAGLRNVQELFPEVRRLRYDPATDRFSDSRGDAEDKVAEVLKDRDARAFGLGRSTIARAVITSQIIKGEAIKADRFESPIAYSLADVGMDEPMAESWGDDAGGVQPGLRNFMAGSKIVHEDGRPVVMYHGTAQDIHAFRGKQAGAIFLSYSPRFAGDFAALSGQWMQDHWDQVLTPEQIEQAKKTAAAAVMADKSVKMAERKAMKQSIMDGKPEGMAADAMSEAARDMMPSGENILPVFVRATAPFDFRDKAMVDDVVGFLFDKNMAGENDKVRIRLVSEKGDRANMNARVMRELISGGAWDVIESPEVQEVIRELGHDGFFVKEDGQINLAVYDPGHVKSVFNRGTYDLSDERLSYSRDDVEPTGFYSALARSVDGIKASAAPAAGWKELVKGLVNKGQAKQDEVEWSGLNDWLDTRQGRVTKDEVLEYLRGNGVKVQEVTLGDETQEAAVRRWMDERAQLEFAMPFSSLNEIEQDYLRGKVDDANITPLRNTKYGQYTLPGGENYREVLLTLPGLSATAAEIAAAKARELSAKMRKAETDAEYEQLRAERAELAGKAKNVPLYRSSHWGQPNILAHIRVNDRTDADGKRVLFVEEAQSDFGQDGKKKGFGLTPSEQRRADALSAKMDAGTASESERAEARELGKNIVNPIPAAPFVTKTEGWLNLALKRIITMAVQGGYDKVAFVTGQQSAERYDLSKQVDSIGYLKHDDGTVTIEPTKNGRVLSRDSHPADKLDDVVGKEIAQRIIDSSDVAGELSGLDLKVGGEGMIAFYDKIVPNAVKALVKRLGGGQLEEIYLGEANAEPEMIGVDDDGEAIYDDGQQVGDKPQIGFTITPAMREKVSDGLPSFSRNNGGFDLPAEGWSAKTRRKMQDYFLRAQVVQRAIASQGGVVDEQTDFYRAEELSHGRMAALMQDFADQQVRPLMEKAVKLGIELDELSLYAYAMHAKERNAHIASIDPKLQDGGSGMTNAEADGILQLVELSGDKAKFEELHTDLMTITRGNRLAMLADGLITQQEFEALEGAYEYYVPLRGFEKLDEDGKPAPARTAGKGFNIRGAETIKAKGRVSRAGQIIENIIHDHQRTIARGERNHVAKVFLNFVLKNPDPSLWEIDAKTTRKSIDRKTGRIARNTVIEKGEDTIAVKVNGQEIYIRIKDDLLLRALRKSHSDETGQLTSDLMKSVGMYSSLLRNTLTRYNPEFAVVNAVRDMGFGATAVLDELGEKGVVKFMRHYAGAMAVSARNESKKLDASREWDKWFYEYKAAGGATSGFYAKGLDEIGGDIRDMMIEAGSAPKDWSERLRFNKATRAAKAALRVLEYAGSVSENAARVAAYRTAREMGKTPSQAASIAKNLTTNFDRKGEYGQMVNALYLFYNAGIQGTHRMAKMLQNPKVWGYMSGVVAGAASLAFASASAGGDDPDDGMAYWDKIPAYVKERNIIIMLPPGAQVEGAEEVGTKGRYLTIPVQYGLNVFHVIGYQIADVVRNQQDKTRGASWKKGGINIASAFAGAFNPFGGAVDLTNSSSTIQAILPTVFDFPYQLASGTDSFGRDVAPFKSPFDTKPDSQNSNVRQAGGPAERVAQWLNETTGGSDYESGAIDVSAGTLENAVRGLTGGTGVFIYDVLALGGKWADYVGGGDPDLFIRDIPILRRGMGETAGDVDQGLFYERRKAIQEARAVEKGAEEAGGEITDKEKLALASMSGDASKYTKWLGQVRKEMKEVQRDKGLTAPERRLKLRELRAERDKLTAEFNASFTEVMREELSSDSGK